MEKKSKYITQSKYLIKNFSQYPKISSIKYFVKIYYKHKQKYFLFINIILLILFFNSNIKTIYLYKNNLTNIIKMESKNKYIIEMFLHNYICIYFPLIDSFAAEMKIYPHKTVVNIIFLKLPIFFELNSLFLSLEYLYNFVNNYKSDFQVGTYKLKKTLTNLNYLQILKLPILLKK